jgi:hypothetical protein
MRVLPKRTPRRAKNGFAWFPVRHSYSSPWKSAARLPPLAVRLDTSMPGPVGMTHQWTSAGGTPAAGFPASVTTPRAPCPSRSEASSQIGPVPLTRVRLNERPPRRRIRSAAASDVRGHSSSSPDGTRTTTSIPFSEGRKNRVFRYFSSQPFGRPEGTKVLSSSAFPRKVTTVPWPCSFTKTGNRLAAAGTTTSSLGPIGIRPYSAPSHPTWTLVRSPFFSERIRTPLLWRVGPLIFSPIPWLPRIDWFRPAPWTASVVV